MTDDTKKLHELDQELIDGEPHQMARDQTDRILMHYFQHVDNYGRMNQSIADQTGEPVIHMTALMMSGLMTHMTNLFYRLDEKDIEPVHAEMLEFLNGVPAFALKIRAEAEGETTGNA